MNLRRVLTLLSIAALAACAAKVVDPVATTASVDAYVAQAMTIAGDDLKSLAALCQPQPAVRMSGEALDRVLERFISLPANEPGRAFENLYFIASGWVSAWVLKTSEGLILFDALDDEKEARELIEGGMVKLGLDPAQLKYIVITHGHGDHYGGATYLANKYKARVMASDADWRMMGGTLEFASKFWPDPPARDVTVSDGQQLTLGDTTVTFYVTPGHTLGTLSPVIVVRHGGQDHRALLWGGTAFNFGKDVPRLNSYIDQTDRLRGIAREQSIDVMISNHPNYDSAVIKLKAMREKGPSGGNPFVIGREGVERSLQVMGTCARAQRDRFLL